MHQNKYALELISDLGLTCARPCNTPLKINLKLTSFDFDKLVDEITNSFLYDPSAYQRLVVRLIYLIITRTDLTFAVQYLSQFMHSPKVSHMHAAIRVLKYIKNSPSLGVFMSTSSIIVLTAYCDADWVVCTNTKKSSTGYVLKLSDSILSKQSKKQTTISRSSTKTEYRSLAFTVAEVV